MALRPTMMAQLNKQAQEQARTAPPEQREQYIVDFLELLAPFNERLQSVIGAVAQETIRLNHANHSLETSTQLAELYSDNLREIAQKLTPFLGVSPNREIRQWLGATVKTIIDESLALADDTCERAVLREKKGTTN